jgi:tripartite-type tricarboxylate transporter receptor subunit TctC
MGRFHVVIARICIISIHKEEFMSITSNQKRSSLTKVLIASVMAIGMAVAAFGTAQAAAYPERPLTIIVPWGAGGGTDAVGRIFANLLEQDLGVPVNVVNRTGGSGVIGHSAIINAKPDGYTIGIATVEVVMMHWVGLTKLTYEDFTVFGQVNLDPGGLMVSVDSPYKNAKDLLAAIKEKPAKAFKASGTGQGGIWHLGYAGWMLSEDVDVAKVPWVPSKGSAPALKDMVAGGVDFITSSLAEGRALIEAGKVLPLANMGEARLDLFPDVPTLKEATGSDWTVGAWRMVTGPKGISQEVIDVLAPAVKRAYENAEYKKFMDGRGFGMVYRAPKEAAEFMKTADTDFGKVMKAAGLTKE